MLPIMLFPGVYRIGLKVSLPSDRIADIRRMRFLTPLWLSLAVRVFILINKQSVKRGSVNKC
jgi:hypothetical protein